jgi:hypothetical protein
MSISRRIQKILPISLLLAAFLFGTQLNAASYTWNGSSSSAWGTAANWTPSGVPGSADVVTFDGSATNFVVALTSNRTVTAINVAANYTFTMGGNLITTDLDISSASTLSLQSGVGTIRVDGALSLGSNCHMVGSGASSVFLLMYGTVGMADLTASIGTKIYTDLHNATFMTSNVVFYDDIDLTNSANDNLILGNYDLYLGVNADIIGHTTDVGSSNGFVKTAAGDCDTGQGRLCKQYTGIGQTFKFPVGMDGEWYTPITITLSCLDAPLTSTVPFPHVSVRAVTNWGSSKGHPDQNQPSFDFGVYWVVKGAGLPFSTGPQFGFSGLMEFANKYRSGSADSLYSAQYKDNWEDACLNLGFWDLKGSVQVVETSGSYRSVPFGKYLSTANDCMYGYGDISCASNTGGTIPVELTSFSARYYDGSVRLKWQTATELNNHGFYVERSLDGENWEDISFIEGAGTSNVPLTYNYTDLLDRGLIDVPQIAYRLRQEDRDGTIDYSGIVYASTGAQPEGVELYKAYPNPFNPSTTLSFSLQEQAHVTLKVYNTFGQQVATVANTEFDAGFHTVEFEGASLPSGVYIAVLEASGAVQQQKLVLNK